MSKQTLKLVSTAITKRSKKRTTTNMVAAISSKKAKSKCKKENAVRQMKLL